MQNDNTPDEALPPNTDESALQSLRVEKAGEPLEQHQKLVAELWLSDFQRLISRVAQVFVVKFSEASQCSPQVVRGVARSLGGRALRTSAALL